MPAVRWLCRSLAALALGLAACGHDGAPASPPIKEGEVPSWAKVAPEQIAAAKTAGVPVAFENSIGMRFVLIPAGTFTMGSPTTEEGRAPGEVQHEVTISKPYYLQTTELTNAQFAQFRPSHDRILREILGDRRWEASAATEVDWADALAFLAWLTTRDAGHSWRLPTEAEWEYACRAGTSTPYYSGEQPPRDLPRTMGVEPVGGRTPNPWGLYDMHGNAWERCADWYAPYTDAAVTDPQGPAEADAPEVWTSVPVREAKEPTIRDVLSRLRIMRGGGWGSLDVSLRSGSRRPTVPDHRSGDSGFRVAAPLPPK